MSIKIYKTTVVGRKMNKLSNNITLTTNGEQTRRYDQILNFTLTNVNSKRYVMIKS